MTKNNFSVIKNDSQINKTYININAYKTNIKLKAFKISVRLFKMLMSKSKIKCSFFFSAPHRSILMRLRLNAVHQAYFVCSDPMYKYACCIRHVWVREIWIGVLVEVWLGATYRRPQGVLIVVDRATHFKRNPRGKIVDIVFYGCFLFCTKMKW